MDKDDRCAELTEEQRACLSLLLRHFKIAEIAVDQNVSVSAINQRLERARKLLGVNDSWSAARMMERYDRRVGTWIPPTGYENTVFDGRPAGPDDLAISAERHAEDHLADIGNGSLASFPAQAFVIRWPFPTAGRSKNDLSATSRMAWVLPIAILFIGLLMLVGMLSLGLQDILARLQTSLARLF